MPEKTQTMKTLSANPKDVPPAEVAGILDQIQEWLEKDQSRKALDSIGPARSGSPWLRNAAGVCQLRLGNVAAALDLFKGLVFPAGSLDMRADAPVVFKTNFCAALLLSDNMLGFQGMLDELAGVDHPAVNRLRDAYRNWRSSMTLWQKLRYFLGGEPSKLTLSFPPGDLR